MRNPSDSTRTKSVAAIITLVLLALAIGAAPARGGIVVAVQSDQMDLAATAIQYNPNITTSDTDTGLGTVSASRVNGNSTYVVGGCEGEFTMYQGVKYYARIYQTGTAAQAYGTIQSATSPAIGFHNSLYAYGTGAYSTTTFVFNPSAGSSIGDPIDITISINSAGFLRHDSEVSHVPGANGTTRVKASGAYALNWDGVKATLYANPFGGEEYVQDNAATQPYSISDSITISGVIGDTLAVKWDNYLLAHISQYDPLGIGNARATQTSFELKILAVAGQAPVPLPGTLVLLVMGFGGFAVARKKLLK